MNWIPIRLSSVTVCYCTGRLSPRNITLKIAYGILSEILIWLVDVYRILTEALLITVPVFRQFVVLYTHLLSYMHQLQFQLLWTHWRQLSCREQSKNAKLRETKSLFVSELLTLRGTNIWSFWYSMLGRLLIGGVKHVRPVSVTMASIGVEFPNTHLYFAFGGSSGSVRIYSSTFDIWLIAILSGDTISKSMHCCPASRESHRDALVSFWHALRMVQRFSSEHQPQNGSRDSKQLEQFV